MADRALFPGIKSSVAPPVPCDVLISGNAKDTENFETSAAMECSALPKLFESTKLFESIKTAAGPSAENYGAWSEEDGIGREWEALTNEIMRLEDVRHQIRVASRQINAPEELGRYRVLFDVYDRRIRECEERLDILLAYNRNPASTYGICVRNSDCLQSGAGLRKTKNAQTAASPLIVQR